MSDDTKQDAGQPESLANRIGGRVGLVLLAILLRLPYRRRVVFAGWVMAHVLGPVAGYRRRAETNLAMVWPDMPARQRRQIARGCCDNFGRSLAESFSGPDFAAHVAAAPIRGPGLALAQVALASGRPVIFLACHFGSHLAPRQAIALAGIPLASVYRPMSSERFNRRYVQLLDYATGPNLPKGTGGSRGFVRQLRSGGACGIMFDVHTSDGTALPYLGHPAMTSLSPAEMALRYDALIVPCFAIRQPDGLTLDLVFEAPITATDPVTMMTEATRRLEAQVHANPEQWFWVHRRWKAPKPA
jgi:KDO2-lipid IV(A) lauroyltransferase